MGADIKQQLFETYGVDQDDLKKIIAYIMESEMGITNPLAPEHIALHNALNYAFVTGRETRKDQDIRQYGFKALREKQTDQVGTYPIYPDDF